MNNAHPFESPTALTNWLSCVAMMLFPFALVLMYGRMLNRLKHAWVIFSVMMVMMIGTIVWAVYYDTLQPNPGVHRKRCRRDVYGARSESRRRYARHYAAHRGGSAGRSASGQSGRQRDAVRHFGRARPSPR